MNGLLEILSNKEWMIQDEFLHGILPTLQYNITNHATLGIERDKKSPVLLNQKGADILREYQVTQDGNVRPASNWDEGDVLGKMREPFVNVMPVDGPITRNGGACSYGSKDIRDWMMKAADNKFCMGHVLVINTPGGSAWAKNDFQQGIEYAHARGQRVIAFVDGLCASAGMYLASLCDEVYVMHPKDQLGCVGVMAAFYTTKNGEKNQFTGETYREYYATKSENKNKVVRDIANDDDATLLIAELDELEAEFRADMKAAFPNATDEHLDGKLFDAEQVMGILCDGQAMLGDVVRRVFDLASGAAKPIERTASRPIGKLATPAQTIFHNKQQTPINMKEKFPFIAALIDVEEMVLTEDGTHFDMNRLEDLNGAIEALQAEAAKVTDLALQVADLKESLSEANKTKDELLAGKDATIATLNETIKLNEETIATLNEQVATLTADVEGAKAALATAEQTIAERDQAIADLNANIEEMQNTPGNEPDAGAAPDTNGEGAQAAHQASNAPQWDPNKSAKENKEALDNYERTLKAQIH